jgi:signal peptide peptidase SppA
MVVGLLTGEAMSTQPQPLHSPQTRKGVAVIPIYGLLTNDGPAHYGSNYLAIAAAAEKAASNPSVERIVLAVDSPGGDVVGLPEAADVLASVAKIKPVSAIVEGTSASAAYWLTSQANDITLTPSGEVGSVGVRMMHVDMSKMLNDSGFKVTELYSGDFKTEWSPYKPLTDAAKADMQGRLSAVHKNFVSAIARGRGIRTADFAAKRFGEGRMFSADEALKHGLVDKVQAPHHFYRAVASPAAEQTTGFSPRRARLELERLRIRI